MNCLIKKQEQVLPINSDATELADEFNKYYIDKIKKIRESIPTKAIPPECCKRKSKGALMMADFLQSNKMKVKLMIS